MRRFPTSRNCNLAAIGLKKKPSRRAARRGRLCRTEMLEERRMLVGDLPEAIPVRAEWSLNSWSDGVTPEQFVVATEYSEDNVPVAVISLNEEYGAADNMLKELVLELRLGSQVLATQEVGIGLAGVEFYDAFLSDRVERARLATDDVTTTTASSWIAAIDSAGQFTDLTSELAGTKKVRSDAISDTTSRLASIAEWGGEALESPENRLPIYRAAIETTRLVEGDRAEEVAPETAALANKQASELGRAALLLADKIAQDSRGADAELAAAAAQLRGILLTNTDSYYTIFAGLGVNRVLAERASPGRDHAIAIVEEATYTANDSLRLELGGRPAVVESTLFSESSRGSLAAAASSTLSPLQDSWVRPSAPDDSGGGAMSRLWVRASGGAITSETYLQFDISGYEGDSVSEAKLNLSALAPSQEGDVAVYAHRNLFGWNTFQNFDESTLTWNNREAVFRFQHGLEYDELFSSSLDTVSVSSGGWKEFDVTEALQRASLGGDANLDSQIAVEGWRGDMESFYLAVHDWDRYVETHRDRVASEQELLYATDINWDGVVDGQDWERMQIRWGVQTGDVTLDGVTDIADLNRWMANYHADTSYGYGGYQSGDADFDGDVDDLDYSYIDAYQTHTAGAPQGPDKLSLRVKIADPVNTDGFVRFISKEDSSSALHPRLDVFHDPDIEVTDFSTSGTQFKVNYNVHNSPFTSVNVEVYRVPHDGTLANDGVLLMTQTGDGTLGRHSETFAANFSSGGISTDGPSEDYRLEVKVTGTPTTGTESDLADNERVFGGGVFIDHHDNSLHVHGGARADTLQIGNTSIELNGSRTMVVGLGSSEVTFLDDDSVANGLAHVDDDPRGHYVAPTSFSNPNTYYNYTWGEDRDTAYASDSTNATPAMWTFSGLAPGLYQLATTWQLNSNRSKEAGYRLFDGDTLIRREYVSQKSAPDADHTVAHSGVTPVTDVDFQNLGDPIPVFSGTVRVELPRAFDGRVIADAVRLERIDAPVPVGDVYIRGQGGDDFISADNDLSFAITAFGGDDADTIYGSPHDDTLVGGMGADTLFGHDGNDDLYGGDGGDVLYGDAGNDNLFGEAGYDQLHEGAGNDTTNPGGGQSGVAYNSPDEAFAFIGNLGWQWRQGASDPLVIAHNESFKLRYELTNPLDFDPTYGGTLQVRVVDLSTGQEVTAGVAVTEDSIEITPPANTMGSPIQSSYGVEVYDPSGSGTSMTSASIHVEQEPDPSQSNEAPSPQSAGPFTTRKDQSFATRLTATDDHDRPEDLSFSNLTYTGPLNLNYSPVITSDGVFGWNPTGSEVGSYTFDYDVRDQQQAVGAGSVTISVKDYNDAPPTRLGEELGEGWTVHVLIDLDNPQPSTDIAWGPYDLKSKTSDTQTPLGELEFSIHSGSLPSWMSLSTDGILSGSYPSDADAGIWTPVIEVKDKSIGDSAPRSALTHFYFDISKTESTFDEYDPETFRLHRHTHTSIDPVYTSAATIAINQQANPYVQYEYAKYLLDESAGLVQSEFVTTDAPAHSSAFDLVGPWLPGPAYTSGEFDYTPELDGEGLDKFRFHMTHPYAFSPGGEAEYDVYIDTVSNDATEYIEVGKAVRADIDVDLAEFEPDATQETSGWHNYDPAADAGDELVALVGYGKRVPLRLGYWLRDDAFPTDFTARLLASGVGKVRIWDAAEDGNEIFAESNATTEWIIDEGDGIPQTVWVEGVAGGDVGLQLSVGGPSSSFFTDLPSPRTTYSVTSDADSVSLYVAPTLNVAIDTDDPRCHCECSCSNSPQGSVDPASGDAKISAPTGNGSKGWYISPQKNAPLNTVSFTANDLSAGGGGGSGGGGGGGGSFETHVYLLAPGEDLDNLPSKSTALTTKLSSFDAASNATSDDQQLYFSEEHFAGIPSGYYLSYIDIQPSGSQIQALPAGLTSADLFRVNSWVPVVKHGDYGFGDGWNMAGIERLIARPDDPGADKLYWIRSDGEVVEFPTLEVHALSDPSNPVVFAHEPTGGFELIDKYNNRTYFDSDGWITARVDPYGNETRYHFTANNQIDRVERTLNGHETKYHWLGDKVAKIEDHYHDSSHLGRVTLLHYGLNGSGDEDHLLSIELPDPTGVIAEGGGPTSAFTYDANGRLLSSTDADNVTTAYNYSHNWQVVTTTTGVSTADEASTTLVITEIPFITDVFGGQAWRVADLANNFLGGNLDSAQLINVQQSIAPPGGGGSGFVTRRGSLQDELGRVSTFMTNPAGDVTELTDASGRMTVTPRNEVGQVTSSQVYDAEGKLVDQMTYIYDVSHNLVEVNHFDVTSGAPVEIADVHSVFDIYARPTSYRDELDREVKVVYSDYAGKPAAAEQITTRVIVGQDDTASSELDDIVTETYYLANGLIDYTVAKRVDEEGNAESDIETHFTYTNPTTDIAGDPDDLLLKSVATIVAGQTLALVRYNTFNDEHNATSMSVLVDDQDDANAANDVYRTTAYEYNRLDRLTKISSPDPGNGQATPVIRYEYTATGRIENVIESFVGALTNEEIITHYNYDNRHRVKEVYANYIDGLFDPLAPDTDVKVGYEYDATGAVTAMIDPLGRTTRYEYDLLNRPVRITEPDPDGGGALLASVSYVAYDAVGRLLAERDANGNVTRYAYDARHRVSDVYAPLGATTHFTYDAADQLTSVTDAEGRVTTSTYDDAGRLASQTLPGQSGTPVTYSYDTLSNLRVETDQLGRDKLYAYDELSRLSSEIDENSDATTYTYNNASELRTLTDPELNETEWLYDGAGRVASEINELDDARAYKYDEFGRLIFQEDREGRVTTFAYDQLHRVTGEKWYTDESHLAASPGSPLHSIGYDFDGASQLQQVTDAFATYDYGYDDLGRQTQVVQTIAGLTPTITLDRKFDSRGRLTETAAKLGATTDYVNTYAYDRLDRLTSLQQTSAGGHAVSEKRVDLAYNEVGQLTQISRYASLDASNPVVATNLAYDSTGRLEQIAHGSVVTHDYTYTADNRLSRYSNSVDGVVDYAYDARGQLTGVDYVGDWQTDEFYNYDDNGNREGAQTTGLGSSTYAAAGANNQLLNDGEFIYTYDAEGNRETRTRIASAAADDFLTEYEWDHRNRLTQVTFKNNSSQVTKTVSYGYDAFGQLVSRVVDTDGQLGSAPLEKSAYGHDDGQIVLQFESTGSGNLTAADLSHRYLWGPAVDQLFADEQVDDLFNAANNETLWALTDNLGTVRDLVDDAGALQNHLEFDWHGNLINQSDPTVAAAFKYTGKFFDEETGLQWNLHRWYDPKVGRWLSEDPLGFNAGDANLSRYVENSTTNSVDPDGLKPWQLIAKILGKPWKSETIERAGEALARGLLEKLDGLHPHSSKAQEILDKLKAAGWIEECLGDGSKQGKTIAEGGGIILRELSEKGDRTGRFLEWYPGNGPHHKAPHWKFSSGESGTIRTGSSGALIMLVPGGTAFAESRFNDGAREVAWTFTPLSWASDCISGYIGWLYNSAKSDVESYRDRPNLFEK